MDVANSNEIVLLATKNKEIVIKKCTKWQISPWTALVHKSILDGLTFVSEPIRAQHNLQKKKKKNKKSMVANGRDSGPLSPQFGCVKFSLGQFTPLYE